MNSEGERAAVAATADHPASVSDGVDGLSKRLGIKESGVADSSGAAPLDATKSKEISKGSSKVGSHERNGSMSEAFLAAPGYSPSFASLGDTNSFESHHRPKYSDTFEGFEPPRLSESHEVQETPKVIRPEGLSFTGTPVSSYKIPENVETPQASPPVGGGIGGFSTPSSNKDQEGENQAAEDYTSPIANLVEKPRADSALPSPSTPTEVVPAPGNADAFSFGAVPETPETPSILPTNTRNTLDDAALPSPSTPPELVPALGNVGSFSFGGGPETPQTLNQSNRIAGGVVHPSPSTPPELVPALGNVNSFPFSEIHGIHAPQATNEPHIVPKKIPGHELLSSFMATSKPSIPQTRENLQGVNEVSPPVIESNSSTSSDKPIVKKSVPVVQETLGEAKSVVKQPKPHDAEIVHSTSRETSLPEEAALDISPSEQLESRASDSPIVQSADASPIQKSSDTSNLTTASHGGGEGVIEKPVEHATDSVAEKELGNTVSQSQIASAPETFAFRNVQPETEVSTSATPATSETGPSLGTLKSKSTKKRGSSENELRTKVLIPKYLSRDMAKAVESEGTANPEGPPMGEQIEAPTCPILVFINSKSGGRLGPELMEHFEDLISPEQVYDLSKHSPIAVLRYGIGCLDRMADSDECARQTRENLRILVAGGDGTVGWVLSSVGAVRELSTTGRVPPVGVIPLGTGNDLSRSFGWGGEFSSTAKSSLRRYLAKALAAKIVPLDTWKTVVVPAKSVSAENIQFPHALKPQQHVPLPSSVAGGKHEKDETAPAFEGLFFNYFSVGMDAQVAYGFHHLRDDKPWLARGRAANQMIYSTFGCTQGWFCTACSVAPRARGVSNILKLSVRKKGGKDWEEIHLPSNVRAVVICNLKSYAGGRNPWGKPSSSTRQKAGLEEQKPDDGLLEIMGLKDGWHSAFVLLEVSTAVRLCQGEAVKLELSGHARSKAYLQMDGEPWMQPMGAPEDESSTVVIIDKLASPSLLLKR